MIKSKLYVTVITAAIASSVTFAEPTVTGKITHESARFTRDGNLIGNTAAGAAIPASKDNFKAETNARIYVDGELPQIKDGTTYHLELQAYMDSQAISAYDSNESDTQRDALREAYIDTSYDDWLIRAGKQQVVWGTADGIKLLDAVNPTDYSELVQNQMEDSRIPVWMVNAEKDLEAGGNFQVVVSQQKENYIPGLNSSGDVGHPFIMKGVDSITGKKNGFLNVTPALAKVATSFDLAAQGGSFATAADTGSATLAPFTGFTVDGFASFNYYDTATSPGQFLAPGQDGTYKTGNADLSSGGTSKGKDLLYDIAQNSLRDLEGELTPYQLYYGNQGVTNLINQSGTNTVWDVATPTSAFEYMPNATFATFNTFAGSTTEYVKDSNAQDGANVALRYKNTTDSGINYSFNLMRKADANPYIDMSWRDSSGNLLTTEYKRGGDSSTGVPTAGTTITADQITTDLKSYKYCTHGTSSYDSDACLAGVTSTNFAYVAGNTYMGTTVMLKDSSGNYYGALDPSSPTGGTNGTYKNPVLRFTEKSQDISNIGGSFDMAIDTEELGPVVIRGEAMLSLDEMTPVVNRKLLAIGDLTGALKMKEADMLRYVLGVDITALTNMMISTQFIQMRNLDYVDNACSGYTQAGNSYDCSEYTGDMATMHLSNGLNRAKKNKEFYSLFLSKPFGESGQHRWNNIFMFEEGGGKWNRLDVEYTIDDNTVATAEVNRYFGDENTQFGQFKNSSNVQVGLKYTF
jgi:hypothetical protein